MLNNFFSTNSAESLLSESDTLAVLDFSKNAAKGAVPVRLTALGSTGISDFDGRTSNIVEVWKTPSHTVECGENGECQWRRSQDYQFLSMAVPCDPSTCIRKTTEDVYSLLLETIANSEHPQLVRFWNLLPNINQGAGDHENYKRFCSGRLAAFREFGIDAAQFPAASAVGHYVDGITVYALSSKRQPANLANPRQVNAYSYPRQYGPTSPSFARATAISSSSQNDAGGSREVNADKDLYFISGTASILGHNSVHQGDLHGQLHTTNDNILYLLKEAGRKRSEVRSLRVYLRNTEHYGEVKKIVGNWYPDTQVVFTHADICRADLLVEIECFCIAD